MSKFIDKQVFNTYDEEWNAAERVGEKVTAMLTGIDMDTTNEEYIVIVEVHKL